MVDRRYGVNTYGDGKLYGPSDARQALAWDVSADWDEDGIFDANEAELLTGVTVNRGRTQLLQESGAGFESIPTGKAVVTLRNTDGRFDGWNVDSPLYPNVNEGKDLRLRVRDLNSSNAPYPLFRGTITNVVPVGYGDDAKVMIYASDGLELLRNYGARVAMQQDITPDEAIAMVLDSVNWPSRWGRSLDVSAETIPYWWASGDQKAMSECEDLAVSFLGYFFVDAQGRARYVKRSSVTAAVASYGQTYLHKDIDNPQPSVIRRNVTRLKVHPRTQAATSTIYQLVGTPPFVLSGGANSQKFFANYSYNNQPVPAENVTISVFEANTQSDFLGTDETADCVASLTDFGDAGMVEVVNNSGVLVYIRLELEGDAVYEPNALDVTYPKELSGIVHPRELLIDLKWQQDMNVATDLSNVLGPFYANLHPIPSVKLESYPALQFAPELFDIVTADIPKIGLNGVSFRVGGIEHQTGSQFENCQSVQTRLFLEPYVSADDFMQWDGASEWDSETVFGY
jgi:hypothetical protein